MSEKSGKMKVTLEVEINEELMATMKDAISKMSAKLPDMMKHGEKKE
jgi:hypothetical protein